MHNFNFFKTCIPFSNQKKIAPADSSVLFLPFSLILLSLLILDVSLIFLFFILKTKNYFDLLLSFAITLIRDVTSTLKAFIIS